MTVTARGATIRVSPHVGTGADSLRLLGDALAEVAATRVVIDAAPGALALSEADIVPAPPALADAVGSDTAN